VWQFRLTACEFNNPPANTTFIEKQKPKNRSRKTEARKQKQQIL
jgi:hypothetical protein